MKDYELHELACGLVNRIEADADSTYVENRLIDHLGGVVSLSEAMSPHKRLSYALALFLQQVTDPDKE